VTIEKYFLYFAPRRQDAKFFNIFALRLCGFARENQKKLSIKSLRPCPECGGDMHLQLINLLYTKEQSELHVEVTGIPANVCTRCFYRILPGKVVKYLDT